MSRRRGQNPGVRKVKRFGELWWYFQYTEGKRRTEYIAPTKQMTKSEAERKRLEFISKLELNSSDRHIPSVRTFADAVKHYRDKFAPKMHRFATSDVHEGNIRNHLEQYFKDFPVDKIDIDAVNEWAWKKREQEKPLSWVTIKNIVRTLQRVLSAFSKNKTPPFSQNGLDIPERDKLEMKMHSRNLPSHPWDVALKITGEIRKSEKLRPDRKQQFVTLILLDSASAVRSSELLALRGNDIDFKASTIRIDEASDQRNKGKIGPPKNIAAYRTVALRDAQGQIAMKELKKFVGDAPDPDALIFRSKRGNPLMATTILNQGVYPALKALKLKKAGMRALRRGCNRRWELAGVNPAVQRQVMGHSSSTMTAHYTGEIPISDVIAEFA